MAGGRSLVSFSIRLAACARSDARVKLHEVKKRNKFKKNLDFDLKLSDMCLSLRCGRKSTDESKPDFKLF
jgi:hypothetical protein